VKKGRIRGGRNRGRQSSATQMAGENAGKRKMDSIPCVSCSFGVVRDYAINFVNASE
jgi:hypothetical protein